MYRTAKFVCVMTGSWVLMATVVMGQDYGDCRDDGCPQGLSCEKLELQGISPDCEGSVDECAQYRCEPLDCTDDKTVCGPDLLCLEIIDPMRPGVRQCQPDWTLLCMGPNAQPCPNGFECSETLGECDPMSVDCTEDESVCAEGWSCEANAVGYNPDCDGNDSGGASGDDCDVEEYKSCEPPYGKFEDSFAAVKLPDGDPEEGKDAGAGNDSDAGGPVTGDRDAGSATEPARDGGMAGTTEAKKKDGSGCQVEAGGPLSAGALFYCASIALIALRRRRRR